MQALKNYLAVRGDSLSERLFLNYQGEPISERGIRKLVVKYRKAAGISKKASLPYLTAYLCHLQSGEGRLTLSTPAVAGTRQPQHHPNLCAPGQAKRQKDHGADQFSMRQRYFRPYRYQFTRSPTSAYEGKA